MKMPTELKLFTTAPEQLSREQRQLLFEQYRLYVELMDKGSERRYQANAFFLTVNSILVTLITSVVVLVQPVAHLTWVLVASLAGITCCMSWRRLLRSFAQLNAGKFQVIHALEELLPARLFTGEWEALHYGDGSRYTPFTTTERRVPLIFAGLYGVISVLAVLPVLS